MSGQVQPFEWDGLRMRVITDEHGEPWFVARDVCAALGFAHVGSALRPLAEDEKGVRTEHTPGGDQQLTTVSEAGLYRLIFGSRIAAADPFRRWVTHDVLPALRRTGTYAVPAREPRELSRLELIDRLAETATLARESEVARLRAEAAVGALLPSATAWDALADSQGDWSLREAAQVLSRDHGVDTGQQRLAASLREIGWTDRRGIPYQRHVQAGRLVQRATSYAHPRTGETVATTQVRITPKGLGRLRELLAPSGAVVHAEQHLLTAVPS